MCFAAFWGDFLILKWGQNIKKLFCCPDLDLFVVYPHYGRQWGYLKRNLKMQQKPNLFMHAWPWNWSGFFVAFILNFSYLESLLYFISKVSRNIFRTERGCVLITQKNLRKFELQYCRKFYWVIRMQPISVLKLYLL